MILTQESIRIKSESGGEGVIDHGKPQQGDNGLEYVNAVEQASLVTYLDLNPWSLGFKKISSTLKPIITTNLGLKGANNEEVFAP